MKPLLQYAKKELSKIKRKEENNQIDMLTITLDFGSKDDYKKPYGYPSVIEALESLGGEHKEEYIREACRMAGVNRESILLEDEEINNEPIIIHVPLPRNLKK